MSPLGLSAIHERQRRQTEAMQNEASKHHNESIGEVKSLKTSVNGLATPHWTLTPTFWVGVVTLIATICVLIVAVLAWLFPREPVKERTLNAQPVPSNSAIVPYIAKPQTNAAQRQLVLPVEGKTSPPAPSQVSKQKP